MVRKMYNVVLCLVLVSLVLSASALASSSPGGEARVQLAVLLDTSNSMDGLINQAKTQLWKIVNELARAKQGERTVTIDVALYEYGKSSLPHNEGYMRMVVALTTDLDKISDELFRLTTNGGEEYCGMVIDRAVRELSWSASDNDLKVIVIAGNEPFTQGPVDFRKACREAIAKGIIVNTIHCGPYDEGVRTSWKEGADLADGSYMNIDQNQVIPVIHSPQDDEIIRLNRELNETYIAYGTTGRDRKELQKKQDQRASQLGAGVMAERAVTKSSAQYKNEQWDLVEADKEGTIDLAALPVQDLPEEMKGMDADERKTYIAQKAKERENVRQQIQKLSEERRQYVEQQMKTMATETLDTALIKTVREQAQKKQFTFDD